MTTLAFDTHAAVKALKEVGFEEVQAEAVVTTVGDAMTGNVDTKADVTELRAATERDIAELRAATEHDIAELRAEMKHDIAELRTAMKHDIAELRTAMKHDIAELRTATAEQFSILYRHLWIMAIGIVGFTAGLTVALVQLIQ